MSFFSSLSPAREGLTEGTGTWLMCHSSSPEWVCRAACTEAEAAMTPTACLQKSWKDSLLTDIWKRCAGSVLELLQALDHGKQLCDSTAKHFYTFPHVPSVPWSGTSTEFSTRAPDLHHPSGHSLGPSPGSP